MRKENYIKNNAKIYTNYQEPNYNGRPVQIYLEIFSPDYGNVLDDFEKLIEKNKKRKIIKPTVSKIPENKHIEVGDSSHLMKRMKIFRRKKIK